MTKVKKFWPFILIGVLVLFFFFPIFKGYIPFPGDLLVDTNPYSAQSFLGFSNGGYPNKAQGPDVINEIYPWRYFSISQLKEGSIPFWNPYNFSGNPQMANFQTGIFYPFNFIYFIFPFNLSWTLLILLQPLLAGIFMYMFLKKGVGLKDFSSFIGGISFAFSSYMVVWIEYGNIGNTILWLPLALLFTKYFFQKPNAKNLSAISIILSFSILAGYIQGVFYIYLLCLFYYLYLSFGTKLWFKNYKKNALFLISLAFPFLLTSFQILPTLQIFSNSTRGAYSLSQIQKNLAPYFYWITIVFPNFFGNPAARNYWLDGTYIERVMYPGAVILFFAFFAFFNKIKVLEKKFFIFVGSFSLIIATDLFFVKYFYLIPIPVVSTTVATRELSIFIFSSVVLGSIGLNHFLQGNRIQTKIIAIYLGFFVLVWGLVFFLLKTQPQNSTFYKVTEHNLYFPTALAILIIIAVFINRKSKKLSLMLITLLVVFDLFYFFNKITPFSPNLFTYPKTPIVSYLKNVSGINRFWGWGSAYIPSDFQTIDKTFSPEGNDPLHIVSYGELLSSSLNGKLPFMLPRPDANIAPGYGTNELKNNFYRKRVLDLLGVKYILNRQDLVDAWKTPDLTTFPKDQYQMVKKIYPWQVYENKNALPRFFLSSSYILAKTKSEDLGFIYNPNIDLKKTLILEKIPSIRLSKSIKGKVSLVSYTPNDVLFLVNASGNTLLFLSDNYYPEWSAKVDGVNSNILIADYTFRAVEVTKGVHKIEFYYNPKSFNLGLGVAGMGLIFLFFTVFYVKNNEKK